MKAVSGEVNAVSRAFHRREARNAAALPVGVPAPRLLGAYDDGTWVALAFEDVAGRQPHVPWREGELGRVLDAVGELARVLTPAPFPARAVGDELGVGFNGWRVLLDEGRVVDAGLDPWVVRNVEWLAELAAPWGAFASGDTLAHADLRADNMLLTPDGVVFVDWPHVVRAAPWFDLLIMLPCVRAQGGPDPEGFSRGIHWGVRPTRRVSRGRSPRLPGSSWSTRPGPRHPACPRSGHSSARRATPPCSGC